MIYALIIVAVLGIAVWVTKEAEVKELKEEIRDMDIRAAATKGICDANDAKIEAFKKAIDEAGYNVEEDVEFEAVLKRGYKKICDNDPHTMIPLYPFISFGLKAKPKYKLVKKVARKTDKTK